MVIRANIIIFHTNHQYSFLSLNKNGLIFLKEIGLNEQTFNAIGQVDDSVVLAESTLGMSSFIDLLGIDFVGTNNKAVGFITQQAYVG